MRTFFDIVLGILLTIVKACAHALVSMGGILALLALAFAAAAYALRRWWLQRPREGKSAEVISIER